MTLYNVVNGGNEILNSDGPMSKDAANQLAHEIERDNDGVECLAVEAKVVISQSDRGHAHTEAAIYADGTAFTADELFAAWEAECEKAGEVVSAQRVYEKFINGD